MQNAANWTIFHFCWAFGVGAMAPLAPPLEPPMTDILVLGKSITIKAIPRILHDLSKNFTMMSVTCMFCIDYITPGQDSKCDSSLDAIFISTCIKDHTFNELPES